MADALADKATWTAWKSIPSWHLLTLQDLVVRAGSQGFMGERAGSHDVGRASHAVTVSQPAAVAQLIVEAASSTTR